MWSDAAPLLAELQRATAKGGTLVVKFDGQRQRDNYTVVVSGPKYGTRFFRQDGADLVVLLRGALAFCATPS
jgi:hypothetical protein